MVLLIALLFLQAFLNYGAFALPTPNAFGAAMLPGPIMETFPATRTPFINSIQVTPTISELVPSLQYGDLTMGGELPIGGTIKVCGCFPVYGMIAVDGALPSAGTAVVDDMFGRQAFEVRCGNPFF
ncbi:unnamed protein product, partial [Iphiclides podalirius]